MMITVEVFQTQFSYKIEDKKELKIIVERVKTNN